ncbi:MAG: DNA polymerase III subunit alpha [Saprospiraceae bacterium]|nr:DNA polymerase III subunit alpha [Saprospiraceae bacterium]
MYLNCHSYYSLRYGTIPVETLVEDAAKAGIEALALTDVNATTGVYDFIKSCREHSIHPVIGMEFREDNQLQYIGLAKNNEGFHELNSFRTKLNIIKESLPDRAPDFSNVYIIYPFEKAPQVLKENEYVGVRIRDRFKIQNSPYGSRKHKLVVLHPVTFRNKSGYNLHRLLRCIDNNVILSMLKGDAFAQENEFMISPGELKEMFSIFPETVNNANRILESCQFDFNFIEPKNKQTYTGTRYGDKELLQKLINDGFSYRYGKNNKIALERVQKELEIIDDLGFGGYFLCTWDIIRYSLSREFYHVGRGSGANSIVAYILKITNVCPIQLNLYFERFLNPARKAPPDFDIDWSWKDRDEILDYIFKRFDPECTAFCGTIGSFKHRSIHRELGKVLGLAKAEIDELSGNPRELHSQSREVRLIHKYADMLHTFPNQRSMHACGVLISEEPLTYYTAMDFPPKGFKTAQFDMYIAEDIGFEKLDVLSQRGLGTIKSTIDLVKETKGEEIDFNDTNIYIDHPTCNEMLSRGRTIGCFYVESPAMRGLLRRLRANNYNILVAASSVIRPGVAKSGMLREFQYRHNNPDDFEYFHPVFEEHLGETYGIMVYQEDVIKIAHYFGGLDMADADILRRGMSGKTRSAKELEKVKDRFFKNCKKLGYTDELTNEVYRQIESFAGYSFCKSHSASYAVESYLALYLKAHHPLEFMVSAINNFGGFYRKEVYFHEAKMAGGLIRPPCVNESDVLACLKGNEIYIGFGSIEGFNLKISEQIVEERENGAYLSFIDFIDRIHIGIEHLELLIFSGAFRFTGKPKNELILESRMLFNKNKANTPKTAKLFREPPTREWSFPKLERDTFEDSFDEIEIIGFPVTHNPFELLKTKYRGDTLVRDLMDKEDRTIRLVGYLVARKDVPTNRGHMNFGTWVDCEGAFFDTTHFPEILRRWPFRGPGCYLMQGKVVVEFGFPSVEIEKIEKLPMIPDPRYEDKRVRAKLKDSSNTSPKPLTRAPYPSKKEVDKIYRKTNPGKG